MIGEVRNQATRTGGSGVYLLACCSIFALFVAVTLYFDQVRRDYEEFHGYVLCNGTTETIELCVVGDWNLRGRFSPLQLYEPLPDRSVVTSMEPGSATTFCRVPFELEPKLLLVRRPPDAAILMKPAEDVGLVAIDETSRYHTTITTFAGWEPCPDWLLPCWHGVKSVRSDEP